MRRIFSNGTSCLVRLHMHEEKHRNTLTELQNTHLGYIQYSTTAFRSFMCNKIIQVHSTEKTDCYSNYSLSLTSQVLWACSSTKCPALGTAPCIHFSVPTTDRGPTIFLRFRAKLSILSPATF